MQKVYTSRDAFNARMAAQSRSRARLGELRSARAKVAHWESVVIRFGGAVHVETLERMRSRLATLEASA